MIFSCHGTTATKLITFVSYYSCNKNITLKLSVVASET